MSRARPLRFFRSELAMIFRRRRNLVLLAILALVPVLIAIAVKASRHGTQGGSIFGGITANGLFAALARCSSPPRCSCRWSSPWSPATRSPARRAPGTLRYLLAVPVGRSRLLGGEVGRRRGVVGGVRARRRRHRACWPGWCSSRPAS